MSYRLNEKQRVSVSSLPADERYEHFLQKVTGWEELWGLSDQDGCVMLSTDDGEECIPVWPHPDYATEWATDEWAECQPFKIDLKAWMERWLPGMAEDGFLVAVFPAGDGEGVIVEPAELEQSILEG